MILGARTALLAVLTLGGVWLLLQLWQVLLVIVVGLMLVGALNPFVERLEGRGLRRSRAIALVFGVLFALAAVFFAVLVPRLFGQLA